MPADPPRRRAARAARAPLNPHVARALAHLVRSGAWPAGDPRGPLTGPAAVAALVEGLRAAGCAAAITTGPGDLKAGRQLKPEYTVTLTAAGSRLEHAVWRAARALADGLAAR